MSGPGFRIVALVSTGLLGCAIDAARQPEALPDLIPRRTLFGDPARVQPRISPDGSTLSFAAPLEGVLNLWVAPVDDPSGARPITRATQRGIPYYVWAYDNRHIVYLQDVAGDENWHAFAVDLASGDIRDLTPIDGVQARIQHVSPRRPGEIVLAINDRDPALHDLYRVDLGSGERRLLARNPGYVDWITDDDLAVRFATSYTEDGGLVLHRRSPSGDWDDFLVVGREDERATRPIGFDRTGDVLYMLDSRDRNTAALFAVDTRSGERHLLYEDPRADIDEVMLDPTTHVVQAASATFERQRWGVLDDSVRGDIAYLRAFADAELYVQNRSLDDRKWIVGFDVSDQPYAYYLYDRDERSARFLFSYRPELDHVALAKMHPKIVRSRDGWELVSYLTLPIESDPDRDGRPREPLPMVLLVHGGPWWRDTWGLWEEPQWLANRGYAVLSVNYRGSTGLGKAFVNAADLESAGRMHDDLIDAVDWAIAEGVADPSRVAIMGGSYGGYATLVGMTFTPERFACGVDIVGPSNLVTFMETIPPYWEPMMELLTTRIGDPRTESGRRLLIERSPLTHVERIQKPLLIGQGANDPRVKQQESDQIVAAMEAKDIPVTYALFPDEGHGFGRPENSLAFNAVAESFLGACLGGRVEPIGDDLEGSSIQVITGAERIEGLAERLVPTGAGPAVGSDSGP